jgi:hypothetical protein
VTSRKINYLVVPYRAITSYSIETAGTLAEFERRQVVEVAVRGGDDVDQPQCGEGSARPADRKHQAGHDDGGGAVRTAAGDRRAGAPPLRWRRGAKWRDEAVDHALRHGEAIRQTVDRERPAQCRRCQN